MILWTLRYNRAVVQYLASLEASGSNLRKAIRELQKGIPPVSRKIQDNPETWEWPEARHWITFSVEHQNKTIRVTRVEEIMP